MSTLTDSDDAQRECCRDVAGTSAVTIARLTRELAEARARIAAVLAECDLVKVNPFASPSWVHVDNIRRALEA